MSLDLRGLQDCQNLPLFLIFSFFWRGHLYQNLSGSAPLQMGPLVPLLMYFPLVFRADPLRFQFFPLLFFKQTSVISWLLIPVIIFCLKFLRVDLKVSVKALKLDCWYYWCFCGTILSWIAPLPASADPDSLIIVILNKRNY